MTLNEGIYTIVELREDVLVLTTDSGETVETSLSIGKLRALDRYASACEVSLLDLKGHAFIVSGRGIHRTYTCKRGGAS